MSVRVLPLGTAAPQRGAAARLARVVLAVVLAASIGAASGPGVAGASALITSSGATGSPFSPNGDGLRERARVSLALSREATVDVTIRDFDGRLVRDLATDLVRPAGAHRWRWNGRANDGRLVDDAFYRVHIEATDALAVETATHGILKSTFLVFPQAPGAITVAVSAGHGGPYNSGAIYGGLKEKDLNLDIALRLQGMFEAAGVNVVMIRTTDADANEPFIDVDGDGVIERADELAKRNDIANLARADVYLSIMNNAYGCHCVRGTETYTNGERTWTPEGVELARRVQRRHLKRLAPFENRYWYPIDRGVRLHDFYSMRPYHRTNVPRPMLMPSILVESLFMDHTAELKVLSRKKAREQIALAYYEGVAQYIARRPYGVRYDPAPAQASVPLGAPATFRVGFVNRGQATSDGWVMEARYVRRVPYYDGSPARGTLLAEVAVPAGIAPGSAGAIPFESIPTPPTAGEWLVKFDIRLRDGTYLSDRGVVALQLPLTTVGPDPTPSPDATSGEAPASTERAGEGPALSDGDPHASPGTAPARPDDWSIDARRPDDNGAWRAWIRWDVDVEPGSEFGHHHADE